MDLPSSRRAEDYINLGDELAEQFKEAIFKRFPNASVADYVAVSGVLVTKLLCSSFAALAKAASPKHAEEWFTSIMTDFSVGTEAALANEGLPVKIGIETVSVDRRTGTQSEN